MPTYEYRCRSCGSTFSQRRPMAESDQPATCPDGHADTVKLLSMFAATSGGSTGFDAAPSGGGGCCGGACGCG